MEYKKLYKIVVVGDCAVGKTNMISRFVDDEFSLESKSTIGVEFNTKRLVIDDDVLMYQLWDTAGQERFKAITMAYYRGSNGALIVYDITKRKTFENVETWLIDLKTFSNEISSILLVGNKSDLSHFRSVSTHEASEFAKKHHLLFTETSALDSSNIDDAFTLLMTSVYEKNKDNIVSIQDNEHISSQIIRFHEEPQETVKKPCCKQ